MPGNGCRNKDSLKSYLEWFLENRLGKNSWVLFVGVKKRCSYGKIYKRY